MTRSGVEALPRPTPTTGRPDAQVSESIGIAEAHVAALAPATTAARPPGAWWAWHPVHGGTGVTTLARAVPGGKEFDGLPAEHGYPDLPLVAVCRSHAAGLSAAQEWSVTAAGRASDIRLVGLVVVADAPGRIPRPLETTVRLISGGYPSLWRVPWVAAWRLGQVPTPHNSPPACRRLLADLAQQSGLTLTGDS